ncbi:hypothetical protein ACGTI2_12480 [Morganella morganii]|uniref:hypothetical protein n=1 Tax=Morganella morganii TaxID=582 RepID=UPI003866A978
MKLTGLLSTISGVLLIAFLLLFFQYRSLSGDYDRLDDKLRAQAAVSKISQSAITLSHCVSLANIKARQTEDTEHVKVKTVIRTVFKDSECAVTPVSSGVVGKLQQYERDIRSRAGSADSGASSR